MKYDKNGGVIPDNIDEQKRAQQVDLITLPRGLEGTSCGNCEFFNIISYKVGHCGNPSVNQKVSQNECCNQWKHKGMIRNF